MSKGIHGSDRVNKFCAMIFGMSLTFLGADVVAGCAGWGENTCRAIDLAHQACTTVKYLGEDGKEHFVELSQDDARELGRAAARRGNSKDGGSDADASEAGK